ncbi:hypothetical protein [Nocardia sp. BMG51109]|uniref:hypothetical protein n=1 Tax=Nocardia sp. BMG51109 TaxID=1056816 RepID=UPI0004669384|nr:hypothetical protein [Nocardia sp. BMG51109]
MSDIGAVIGDHSGRAHTVLRYAQVVEQLVTAAKQPGFGADGWAPLAELVDTGNFVRVGNFKEVMTWAEYTAFLTGWAPSAQWDCTFKRITEHGDVVFLELEERSAIGDFTSVVNSMSVYEFDAAGKITHIDVYLQMELPKPEMLAAYDGADIAQ